MKPILNHILSDIQSVLSRVEPEQYDNLVTRILEADRVFVAGAGRSLLMMKAFAMRLMHMGKTVYVVGETVTPAAGSGDLLILGTGSGETAILKAVAGKAEKAGVRILTITTNDQSTLAKQADDLVLLPASVNHLNPNGASWQPGGNSFEQSLLLRADVVVLDVAQKTGMDLSGKLTLHANLE